MSIKRHLPACAGWLAVLIFLPALGGLAAQVKALKFQAILVWATNDGKSPDPSHKPVEEDVRKKLNGLPLKWSNFFEVKRTDFSVQGGASATTTLSDKCQVKVAHVTGNKVEVSLIGKGEPVLKRSQSLARGQMLVLGGNAPDKTGWLVVLKRMD